MDFYKIPFKLLSAIVSLSLFLFTANVLSTHRIFFTVVSSPLGAVLPESQDRWHPWSLRAGGRRAQWQSFTATLIQCLIPAPTTVIVTMVGTKCLCGRENDWFYWRRVTRTGGRCVGQGTRVNPFTLQPITCRKMESARPKKPFHPPLLPPLDRFWLRNPATWPSIRLVTTSPMPIDVTLAFHRQLPLQSPT